MYNVRTWIGGVIYKNSDPLCVLVLGKIKWGKKLLSSTNICLREEKDLLWAPKVYAAAVKLTKGISKHLL